MADQRKTQFPSQPLRSSINSVHIDAARRMHQLTTNSRIPPHARTNINAITQTTAPFARPANTNQNAFKSPQNPVKLNSTESSAFPTKDNENSNNVCVPAIGHQGKCSNPLCAHCGAVIIPAPSASFPLQDTPSISIGNWQIFSKRNPILNASEIEATESLLKFPVPEMIFGNNLIKVICEDKFHIEFNATDALRRVQLNPENLVQTF
ncbi:unnamed protein product [Ambrosiozyma monospora]|uniref:Unnamed protein product n=1 Tax=Ambrosiozyma monospora TaxID=43982 RepID=A0A9W7DJN3_AMBMO|nr:unnamed protein product [Ambrosiozyma monospora]